MSDLPAVMVEAPVKTAKSIPLADVLPIFSATDTPPVYIENMRFDAHCFAYQQPLTRLGKAGFIVDYGYRLGYFPSTWQGQPNRSLIFQDLQQLFNFAKLRLRNPRDFNHRQLGRWSRHWSIHGNNPELITMAQKIEISLRTPPC